MGVEPLVMLGIVLTGASGIPGVWLSRKSPTGQQLSVLLVLVGCCCVTVGAVRGLTGAASRALEMASPIVGVTLSVGVDALSAIFLLPICVVSMAAAVYGLSYWKQSEHPDNGRRLTLFLGLLAASMQLLVVAQDGVLFLFAWETMALSAFFLVGTEDQDAEVRGAAWLYLGASHFATLNLFVLFALFWAAEGTFGFVPLTQAGPALATAVFLVALLGFGTKAGIMPLHIWLPSAHAMAPSHISALLSGVMIKMGIYGLVRVYSLLPAPPEWWGALLMTVGVISGVVGVAFAVGQHDLKRLLAYHSIENIGIIVLGLGLALLGRSIGREDLFALGLAGALLHTWNHALFKSLLFLSAGSVIHAVHTREIDHLGGLLRAMPRTAICFLIGAVAICGLPPLNGFVSEFLIYLGLFRTLLPEELVWPSAAFGAPALALMGVLAAACFAKVFGAVFLGAARSDHARHAHESDLPMLVPMLLLSGCCIAIGVAPLAVAPTLQAGVAAWAGAAPLPAQTLTALAPLGWISVMAGVLIVLTVLGGGWYWLRLRQQSVGSTVTWDCGYAAPTARMQYTSSSFAEMLVKLFGWALRPRTRIHPPQGLFPRDGEFESHVPDTVLDGAVLPAFRGAARLFTWFRVFQQGSLQIYLLYIFAILVLLLLWSIV